MRSKGQSVIWGFGAILLAVGSVLFLMAFKDYAIGLSDLAILEYVISGALLSFAIISFYMAHKQIT
jgi:hypothetical protein